MNEVGIGRLTGGIRAVRQCLNSSGNLGFLSACSGITTLTRSPDWGNEPKNTASASVSAEEKEREAAHRMWEAHDPRRRPTVWRSARSATAGEGQSAGAAAERVSCNSPSMQKKLRTSTWCSGAVGLWYSRFVRIARAVSGCDTRVSSVGTDHSDHCCVRKSHSQ